MVDVKYYCRPVDPGLIGLSMSETLYGVYAEDLLSVERTYGVSNR